MFYCAILLMLATSVCASDVQHSSFDRSMVLCEKLKLVFDALKPLPFLDDPYKKIDASIMHTLDDYAFACLALPACAACIKNGIKSSDWSFDQRSSMRDKLEVLNFYVSQYGLYTSMIHQTLSDKRSDKDGIALSFFVGKIMNEINANKDLLSSVVSINNRFMQTQI